MANSFPTIPNTDTSSSEYKKIKAANTKDRLLQEIYHLQRQQSGLTVQLTKARQQRDRAQLQDFGDVIKRFRQLTAESLKQQSRQAAAELRTIWSWAAASLKNLWAWLLQLGPPPQKFLKFFRSARRQAEGGGWKKSAFIYRGGGTYWLIWK